MHETLAVLAGIIAISAAVPYIRDTLRGKTKPNIVTWFTWTLLNGINAVVAFSDGAVQTAIFSALATVATLTIVVLGFRQGLKRYTRFDVWCQVVALLGIPLWLVTDTPELAVLIVLVVDLAGGLPTLRHAWQAPHEETLRTFVISMVAGAILLVSLRQYTFVAIAMPLYVFLFDMATASIIMYRRKASGN